MTPNRVENVEQIEIELNRPLHRRRRTREKRFARISRLS
jgi:hypothetical protein